MAGQIRGERQLFEVVRLERDISVGGGQELVRLALGAPRHGRAPRL